MNRTAVILAAGLAAGPTLAQDLRGDAGAGETLFQRQCVSCHVVVDDAGTILAGRNARTGPNLYGIPGQVIGSVEGFAQYGDGLTTMRDRGMTWDEASFVAYVQNPTEWLRETLGDSSLRGRMAFQVRDEQQAYDIYAYLASLGQ